MHIYPDEVRRAMQRRGPVELNWIASGQAVDYTPEAQEIAREVLKERLAMPPQIEEPPLPLPPPRETWGQRFAAWRRRQLPAEIPDRIADLFWFAILFASGAVVPLLRIAVDVPPTAQDAVTLALAAVGITLAHGIYRQRLYPRPLAILFVTTLAILGLPFRRNENGEREFHLFAIFHAWSTIKYLVRDVEALDYYARLEERRLLLAPAES